MRPIGLGRRDWLKPALGSGVKRLVCLSTLGFGDIREMLRFVMRYIVVPLFLRHAFADHALQEELVKQSGLDWIIVADFMLKQLTSDEYLRQTPGLSY